MLDHEDLTREDRLRNMSIWYGMYVRGPGGTLLLTCKHHGLYLNKNILNDNDNLAIKFYTLPSHLIEI